MSLKKTQQLKNDRGFKPADLIIYGIIVLLVAAAFIWVFASRDSAPLSGFTVYVGNTRVFEYDFTRNKYAVLPADGVEVETEEGANLTVTVRQAAGYNVLEVDVSAKSVRVVQADCGRGDCVFTPAVRDNSGIIYCSPHRLRIVPFNFDDYNGDILI